MSNLQLPDVTDLDTARAFLGNRQFARLGHNTTIRLDPSGDITVTYHRTDIITYARDGSIVLRADGWVTATTAARLHRLTPSTVAVSREMGDFLVTILPTPGDWQNGVSQRWDGLSELHITEKVRRTA